MTASQILYIENIALLHNVIIHVRARQTIPALAAVSTLSFPRIRQQP